MTSTQPPQAQQGHRYRVTSGPHSGAQVLALSSGQTPRVAPILAADWPFLGEPFLALSSQLQPLPMTYFHGHVPAMT